MSPERAYIAEHFVIHPDTIRVGDTIWIESWMDCYTMSNLITNNKEVFCNQDFSFPLGISKLLDSLKPASLGAVDLFTFTSQRGFVFWDSTIPGKEFFMQVKYDKTPLEYVLKIGLVPKTQGLFLMTVRPGGSFNNKHCDRSTLDNLINNENRGQDIYIEYRFPQVLSERDLRNIYCFEVQ